MFRRSRSVATNRTIRVRALRTTLAALWSLLVFGGPVAGQTPTPATFNPVPQADANFVSDTQTFMREEDPDRYDTGFNDYRIAGCSHPTAAGKTGTFAADCQAIIDGHYVLETSSTIDYDALGASDTDTVWVILHEDTTTTLGGNWIRVAGTHYFVNFTDATGTRPTRPADAMYVMEVTLVGGAITAVRNLYNEWPTVERYTTSSEIDVTTRSGRWWQSDSTGAMCYTDGSQCNPHPVGASEAVVFNVRDYNAQGDIATLTDVLTVTGTDIVTSASAGFTSADMGKQIGIDLADGYCSLGSSNGGTQCTVDGDCPGGACLDYTLDSEIIDIISPTQVQIADDAQKTKVGVTAWYGTNDTAAFQAALDAAHANGHGQVFVPAGDYWVERIYIESNTTLQGENNRVSLLRTSHREPTGNKNAQGMISNRNFASGSWPANPDSFITVSDLTIERLATRYDGFHAFIEFGTVDYGTIRNCRIIGHGLPNGRGYGNKGINAVCSRNTLFENNYLRDVQDNYMAFNWCDDTTTVGPGWMRNNTMHDTVEEQGVSNIVVTHDDAWVTGNYSIKDFDIGGTNFIEMSDVKNLFLVDNFWEFSNAGIRDCENVVIANNVVRGDASSLIELSVWTGSTDTTQNISIVGNSCSDGCRIKMLNESSAGPTIRGIVVAGNSFSEAGSATFPAISVISFSDVTIADNTITNSLATGISVAGTGDGVVISGNTVSYSGTASAPGHGAQAGIAVSGSMTHVMVMNNVSHNNGEEGYYMDQGQYNQFIDNVGWNNATGLFRQNNPTMQGPEPLTLLKLTDAGAPLSLHAGPGSVFIDDTLGMTWVKRAGTDNTGWGRESFEAFSDGGWRSAGTSETDMSTYTLPASMLSTNGDAVHVVAQGITTGNANDKTMRIYFGTTAIGQIGPGAYNYKAWFFDCYVVRSGATTQRTYCTEVIGPLAGAADAITHRTLEAHETLSGTVVVKSTGEAPVAGSDITQHYFTVDLR